MVPLPMLGLHHTDQRSIAPAAQAGARRPPLYRQLADDLGAAIERGDFPGGSPLPSEHALCALYAVSRVTVRGALRHLTQAGLIERRHGAGSFVKGKEIRRALGSVVDFRAEAERHGRKPATLLLACERRPATLRERMLLPGQDASIMAVLTRLRLLDGAPAVLQTSAVPGDLIPPGSEGPLARGSLYAFLAAQGAAVVEARDVVEAVALGQAEAKVLRLPAGSPVFRFHRVGRTATGRTVEISESLVRSDFYKLVVDPRLGAGP